MSPASALMPKPAASARIVAPRLAAAASGSRTTIAAPSPSTMPERVLQNGRQVSVLITRIASQPFIVPKVMQASAPPASAASTEPERTM